MKPLWDPAPTCSHTQMSHYTYDILVRNLGSWQACFSSQEKGGWSGMKSVCSAGATCCTLGNSSAGPDCVPGAISPPSSGQERLEVPFIICSRPSTCGRCNLCRAP